MNGKCSSTKYTTQSYLRRRPSKTWTPANHNTWNGCVTDRGLTITNWPDTQPGNYDENVDRQWPAASQLYPAEQYASCPGRDWAQL